MKSLLQFFLNILFPERCLGCKSLGSLLCESCLGGIRTAERETDRDIYAAFDYRDPLIKRAIWSLKYHRKKHLGELLGNLLYQAHIEEIATLKLYAGENPFLVIPVPLSRTRKKTRGYNQAECLARGFCENAEKNMVTMRTDLIKKNIDTTPQAKIANRTARLRNIRGAFTLANPALIKGRTIIVIDDVTTTGGTLGEILKLLKKSGAKEAIGFAVAH